MERTRGGKGHTVSHLRGGAAGDAHLQVIQLCDGRNAAQIGDIQVSASPPDIGKGENGICAILPSAGSEGYGKGGGVPAVIVAFRQNAVGGVTLAEGSIFVKDEYDKVRSDDAPCLRTIDASTISHISVTRSGGLCDGFADAERQEDVTARGPVNALAGRAEKHDCAEQ